MSDEPNHTPTPWEVDVLGYLRGPNSENVLEEKENAFFVVRAVNSHEKNKNTIAALVEAAKIGIRMGENLADAHENRMTETFREEMEKMREALKAAGVKL